MSIWYKLSLICGLLPLALGGLIFFSWLVTHANWLMVAGIYNIMAGLVFFVCGLSFLFVYGRRERKKEKAYPTKRLLVSLSILLANFPAAVLAIYAAEYVEGTSVVTVINNSSFDVKDLILSERERSYSFPLIAPGQEVTKYFHFEYEGSVDYRLSLNGSPHKDIMFGYVTRGMGGRAIMVITKEGTVTIRK